MKRATKSEDAPKLTNHNLFGFINSHEWDQIVNMIDGTKDVDTSDAWKEKESLVVCTDEHFPYIAKKSLELSSLTQLVLYNTSIDFVEESFSRYIKNSPKFDTNFKELCVALNAHPAIMEVQFNSFVFENVGNAIQVFQCIKF